jgi:two-component system OmpR family sensor kinase
VEISVATEGDKAVLTVDDDGPGIAATDRSRVFEPLYSLRPPSIRGARKETGTGLGLTTVRALTTAMGGTVEVDDATLGGARLIVRLPLRSP